MTKLMEEVPAFERVVKIRKRQYAVPAGTLGGFTKRGLC